MPFKGVVNSENFEMLVRVLDSHCDRNAITREEDRNTVALTLLTHFQRGVDDEEALAKLISVDQWPREQTGALPSRVR